MQGLREIARQGLARSLRRMAEEDRLALALPAVCGSAMAAHCAVARLDESGTLHLQVDEPEWLDSLVRVRELLQNDLQRVSGVVLAGLHFEVAGSDRRSWRR